MNNPLKKDIIRMSRRRLVKLEELDKIIADSSEKNRNFFIAYLVLLIYVQFIIFSTTDLQILTSGEIRLPFGYLTMPLSGFYFAAPIFIFTLHINFLQNLEVHHNKLMRWMDAHPHKTTVRELVQPFLFDHAELMDNGTFQNIVHHANNLLCLNFAPITLGLLLWRYSDRQEPLWTGWHLVWFSVDSYWLWRFREALEKNKQTHISVLINRPCPRPILDKKQWNVKLWKQITWQTLFQSLCWPIRQLKNFLVLAWNYIVATILRNCLISLFGVFLLVETASTILISYLPSDNIIKYADFFDNKINPNVLSLLEPRITIDSHRQTSLKLDSIDNKEKPDGIHIVIKNLKFAQLSGLQIIKAQLEHAQLVGADLSNADLQGADLNNANLQRTRLLGAHLQGATLMEANLLGADLTRVHFEEGHLNGAHLQRAILHEAHFQKTHLEDAVLKGADLTDIELTGAFLTNAHLEQADLTNAHLEQAYMVFAHLDNAILLYANLENAELKNAWLNNANLNSSILLGAKLQHAQLMGADLQNADLTGADLSAANFHSANLKNAKFQGAIFKNTNLTGATMPQVSEVFLDAPAFMDKKWENTQNVFKHTPDAIQKILPILCKKDDYNPEDDKKWRESRTSTIKNIRESHQNRSDAKSYLIEIDRTLCLFPDCANLSPYIKGLDCKNFGHKNR